MLKETLIEIFERDLDRLKSEINAYRDESNIWYVGGAITNSAGNLVLHLMGNLNHFIGTTLGNTGYVREREKEFLEKNVGRAALLQQVDDVKQVVTNVLSALKAEDLEKLYPLEVLGKKDMSTTFFLVHLATHLNYHLGQINYLRRLSD